MNHPSSSSNREGGATAPGADDSPQQPGRPSLLSGLHRPTLSGATRGTSVRSDLEETLSIPARPRRLWKVSDTNVPVIPPFYPTPLNPRLCAHVADASPSVVAVRIAEALRRQSIAVEYDEESVTATCMTVDHCRFVIHLWQAMAPSHNATAAVRMQLSSDDTSSMPGMKPIPGLLVEFRRVSGNTMTFHSVVSALKKAAKSHGTGQDVRPLHHTSPSEFPRYMAALTAPTPPNPTTTPDPTSRPPWQAIHGLEHALGLLRKDRLDAQLRGMEELLALSDAVTSGLETALTASMAILGAPLGDQDGDTTTTNDLSMVSTALHQNWIYRLLVDRELPDEAVGGPLVASSDEPDDDEGRTTGLAFLCGFGGEHDASTLNDKQIEQMRHDRVRMGDEYHGGQMRCMALRILANALVLLSRHNPKALYQTLSTHGAALMSEELFQALWHDAAGANRPPGVVAGTRLASPHEAAMAIRCIRLLGQAHPKAKQRLIKHKKSALQQLEKCYFIGQAVHEILEYEAKRTYRFLTAHS